jgi:hypothetical protein
VDILRCQVRVIAGEAVGPCGAEAKKLQIVYPERDGRQEPYGIVTCEEHAVAGSEDIGMKANHELREYCESLGATPAF